MELIYTVGVDTDEPIMLIDKHIGFDAKDGVGIMGSQFQKELLFLDTLKKKRIQVWINSPGGIVMDGYDICNSIMRTKTKVDTYCYGLAASIAGIIFLTGRTKYMTDYGMLMVHEAYEEDPEGNKTISESTKKMNDSIVAIITARTGIEEGKIKGMMSAETWLSATEAKEMGMCDVIESSAEINVPRVKKGETVQAMWQAFQPVFNKVKNLNKPIFMKNVANKLGLNAEASEESILKVVSDLQVKNSADEEKVKKAEEEMDAMKAKMAEDEEKYKKMEAEASEAKAAIATAEASAKAATESEANLPITNTLPPVLVSFFFFGAVAI